MNCVGIDYSSLAVDIVQVDLDDLHPPAWHRFELVGQDAFDRTRSVRPAMPYRMGGFWEDTLAIGIEHPAGKFGTGPMMRVQGAVLACLPSRVVVKPWPPGQWRKAVGLAGNASKEDVRGLARIHSGSLFTDQPYTIDDWPFDACDAWAIALATRAALVRPAEAAA